MTDTTIFWFRRDFRLTDNAALAAAAKGGHVLPVYVYDDGQESPVGGASKWWLHHALVALDKSLGGKLVIVAGDAGKVLPDIAVKTGATAVHWNACHEPAFVERDAAVAKVLADKEIASHVFDETLLWPMDSVVKKDGTPFKVFTPFLNAALAHEPPHRPAAKAKMVLAEHNIKSVGIDKLGLLPDIHWDKGIAKAWQPGETAGHRMLQSFVADKLAHYAEGRNLPARDVLSRLSPYLHYGEVSPHQIWHAVHDSDASHNNKSKFISEVCWRDFSTAILRHFPETASESYNARLKKLHWHKDDDLLKKWQRGQTGIPIVDAGMRQLWQTGYMHNRVRMITASFLIKNFLIDWRIGADWFLDCLVDADLAVNTMNWQWVAGSGLDAAPFFRVFNPVLQSRKFDADGDYLVTYLPELKNLPAKYRHEPWSVPPAIARNVGFKPGHDYPAPCVDLRQSSQAALEAYRQTA